MRILFLDIETSPHISYTWGLWNQNVGLNQIVEPSRTLCFAAKWHGEKSTNFFAEWQAGGADRMIEQAYTLLDEADVVVHYNGDKFDLPRLRSEMVTRGYRPPSPSRSVDLYKTVRSRFRFASNKLEWICQQLGVEHKADAGGMGTWKGVLAGNNAARKRMREYNIQDVVVTEQVHDVLRPWIANYPNPSLYNEDLHGKLVCPCGSEDVQRRGFYRTNLTSRQRYRCTDCGRWSTGGPMLARSELRSAN